MKIVAFTVTTTLSSVITSWRSPGTGISRMSTVCSVSTNGTMIDEAGLVGPAVLAEALDDADLALLDDVDRLRRASSSTITIRPAMTRLTMLTVLMATIMMISFGPFGR